MAAEDEIPKHYQQQFNQNVAQLVQKNGSLLYPYVAHGGYTGESAEVVKQFGPTAARRGDNTRYGDTPIMSTPRDQRWVFPEYIDWGDLFDRQDLMKMLLDPTSILTKNAKDAMGREIDAVIIDAIFGDAKTGKNGGTTTVFPPTSQNVAITVGSADGATDVGMNVAKIIKARKVLRKNYVNVNAGDLCFVGGASQEEDLFNDDKFVNRRYRRTEVLEDADSNEFFRCHFVFLEEMPLSGTTRSCALFPSDAIHLGEWETLMVNLAKNPSKKFNWQLYLHQNAGATRTQEKSVARIQCKET